jgi:phospholipid transport system substrate-binding protein
MKFRTLTVSALIMFLSTSVNAQPPMGYGHGYQQGYRYTTQSPAEFLQEGINKLTSFMEAGISDPHLLEEFLNREIAPYFDFAYMTRWAAGSKYRYMTPQQLEAMENTIRSMFMGSMIQKLAGYKHGYVQYLPVRRDSNTGEVTLGIQAYAANSRYPTRLDFRLYLSPQGWKVFDVKSNGQSAVVYYRQHFAREARYGQQQIYPGRYQMQRQYGYR